MSEMKATPGPWFACHPKDLGMTVARLDKLWAVKCDEPVEPGEHDAHLIAAAPELYEVLAKAVRQGERILAGDGPEEGEEFDGWFLAAKAALAKARGETS